MTFRHLIFWHYTFAVIKLKVTPIGYFKCIRDGFRRIILKHLPHFINAFKVEMVVEPQPLLIIDGFLRLDTKENIVHSVVRFAEVVAIVCTDEREIELFRQLNHYWVCFKFLVDMVILDLNVEVPFPHYLHQRFEVLDSFFSST